MRGHCKKHISWFLVLGSWLLVVGLAKAEIIERVVAVVNDEVLTLYDLDRAMAPLSAAQKNDEGVRRQILENLIHQKLLEQEVAKADIEVTEADLQQAIAGILAQNNIPIEVLRSELAAKGISFEAYKKQITEQIRQAKFIQQNLASQVQITALDVRAWRAQNRMGGEGRQKIETAWIFLPWAPEASDKEKREQVAEARTLAEKWRRGGKEAKKIFKKFERRERSGWTDELTTELREAVQKLPVGAVSDPVAAPEGVYVIRLVARQESETAGGEDKGLSDEQIRQRLYGERLDREIHNYVVRLRKKAFVEMK